MSRTTDIGRPDAAVPSTPTSSPWPGIMTVVAVPSSSAARSFKLRALRANHEFPAYWQFQRVDQARYADNVIPTAA